MNTPKPCINCKNLYACAMSKDDPTYQAECKLELPMGNMKCKSYEKQPSMVKILKQMEDW